MTEHFNLQRISRMSYKTKFFFQNIHYLLKENVRKQEEVR